MNCRAVLINDSNNKVIKQEVISRDTYILCEEEILKRNSKLSYPKRWKITDINV